MSYPDGTGGRQVPQPPPARMPPPAANSQGPRKTKKGEFIQTLFHFIHNSRFVDWTDDGVGFTLRCPLGEIAKNDSTFEVFTNQRAFHKNLNMHGYTQQNRGVRTWRHRDGLSLRDLGALQLWHLFPRTPEKRRERRQVVPGAEDNNNNNNGRNEIGYDGNPNEYDERENFQGDDAPNEGEQVPPPVQNPAPMAKGNARAYEPLVGDEEMLGGDGGIKFSNMRDAPMLTGVPCGVGSVGTNIATQSPMYTWDGSSPEAATYDPQQSILQDENTTFDRSEMALLGELESFLSERASDSDGARSAAYAEEEDTDGKSTPYPNVARAHQPSSNDVKAAEATLSAAIANAQVFYGTKPVQWRRADSWEYETGHDEENDDWEDETGHDGENNGDSANIAVADGNRLDTSRFGHAVPTNNNAANKPTRVGQQGGGGAAAAGDGDGTACREKVKKPLLSALSWVKLAGLIIVLAIVLYAIFHVLNPRPPTPSPPAAVTNAPSGAPAVTPTPSTTAPTAPQSTSAPSSQGPSADPSNSPSIEPTKSPSPTADARIPVIVNVLTEFSLSLVQAVGSPQRQAMEWLTQNSTRDELQRYIQDEVRLIQRYSLAVFYFTLGGPTSWAENGDTTWLVPGMSECDWAGITCNEDGRVTAFDLNNFKALSLQGSLPEEIYELTSMQVFNIRGQPGLVGTISPSISKWTNLQRMELRSNGLEGPLPPQFPSNLTQIGLQGNRLTGSLVASSLPSNLRILLASNNNFTGTLPNGLGNISTLSQLDLGGNFFTGTIPEEVYNLKGLAALTLSRCMLTGAISSAIGTLGHLELLRLHENSLNGTIPTEIGRLTNLRSCRFYANQLSGPIPTELGRLRRAHFASFHTNQLTGSLPTELGNMESLFQLVFFNNRLNGTIADELTRYSKLRVFDLDRNELSGTIPTGLANMNLQELWLFENKLTGTLPTELSTLESMHEFWLSDNNLVGTIPSEYGNLALLKNFSLSGNALTGTIPPELGSMSALKGLRLGDNNLNGTIPTELGMLENLQLMHLTNAGLSGTIPTQIGQLSQLLSLFLGNNSLVGAVPRSFCIGDGSITPFTSLEADCQVLDGSPKVVCDCCTQCF